MHAVSSIYFLCLFIFLPYIRRIDAFRSSLPHIYTYISIQISSDLTFLISRRPIRIVILHACSQFYIYFMSFHFLSHISSIFLNSFLTIYTYIYIVNGCNQSRFPSILFAFLRLLSIHSELHFYFVSLSFKSIQIFIAASIK